MNVLWDKKVIYKILFIFLCLGLISGISFYSFNIQAAQTETSVTITVEPYCGDGTCNGDETCSTCPADCGVCDTNGGGGIVRPPTFDEIVYYTKVIFEGMAYPNAKVDILKDGQFLTTIQADSEANFKTEISGLLAGTYAFGFLAEDKNGTKSSLFNITFYVASAITTTVSGILIPPTVNIKKDVILKGEGTDFFGQTIPYAMIEISINSEETKTFQKSTLADYKGDWYYLLDTEDFEPGVYIIKAKSSSDFGLLSVFSKELLFKIQSAEEPIEEPIEEPEIPFFPIEGVCPGGDLNKDDRTNIVDFSIMLYLWGSADECVDQNSDGTVDLIDFSILLYYWIG